MRYAPPERKYQVLLEATGRDVCIPAGKKMTRHWAECTECGELIKSEHKDDFELCYCGAVFIAGGVDHPKYGGPFVDAYKDLSEYI